LASRRPGRDKPRLRLFEISLPAAIGRPLRWDCIDRHVRSRGPADTAGYTLRRRRAEHERLELPG